MRNKFYLKEFQFFDGEDTVVFNIVSVDDNKITVAVTKCGKIVVTDYDLYKDDNGLYFEYGVAGRKHIHIDDFEEKYWFMPSKRLSRMIPSGVSGIFSIAESTFTPLSESF